MKQGGMCKELESYEFYGPMPFLVDDEDFPVAMPVADVVNANGKPILINLLKNVLIPDEVLLL